MVNTETISTNWNKSNEEAYEGLIVSLEANKDILNLLICVCNNSQFREEIIERYCKELEPDIHCYRITLNQKEPSLRAAIAELVNQSTELQKETQAVITATGVESLHSIQWNEEKSELDKFFGYLQWTREGLREFPYSIVLWVTSTVEVNLRKKAPDFWSWRKGVFRFVSSQSNFVPCGDFFPILKSFEEIYTDSEVPLISLEDLLELIQQIETTKGKKEPRLASLYASLGKIYHNRLNQGQFEDYGKEQDLVIEYYQKAINLQKTLNLELDLADSLNRLADLYRSRGQYEQAIVYIQQSLSISQKIRNVAGEGRSYMSLGTVYNSLGRYEEAIDYYQQSLAIFQRIKDIAGEGISYNNLGTVYRFLGRYEEAIDYYQQSLAISQQIGDVAGKERSYNNLSDAYHLLGRYEEAIDYLQQSLAICQRIKDIAGEGNSYISLGNAYHSLGRYEEAIDYYQKSLAICHQIGDIVGEGNCYYNLGLTFTKLNRKIQAKEAFQKARDLYQRMGLEKNIQDCDDRLKSLEENSFV